MFRSLGVKRPKIHPEFADRVPPGQYLIDQWPVLSYGVTPVVPLDAWRLKIFGAVAAPMSLTWAEFSALDQVRVTADMHCVTRWSKLDMIWEGVSFRTIADLVCPRPEARYVVFHGDAGYSANAPLSIAMEPDVLLASAANGEPLSPDHGFPVRAVVPARYAWKSAKWLVGIEFLEKDRPGFWERFGYHNNGDFLSEERFA
jgi:DMSO/TMAO reductase YedYZ molybdopterin-dependent catalytic subunit